MSTTRKYTKMTLAAAAVLALGGCAGMSRQEKSTAVGTGVGAAVAGVMGHEVGKKK